jgi:hypothetical protein
MRPAPPWLVPLTALALLAAPPPARPAAPLAAGGRVVTGSIAFSSAGGAYYENDAGDRTQEWMLQPGGGVFVVDGLACNLLASGTWFRQGDVVANHYEIGPTAEYYFDTVGDDPAKGHALPYVGAGYLWGKVRSELPGSTSSYNSGVVLLKAGLAWMVADHTAADIAVQHRFGTYTEKHPQDGPKFRGNRWTVHWGMKVFLP